MQVNQALGSGDMLVGDKVRFSLDLSAIVKQQPTGRGRGSRAFA
jgi:hypothetical protein